MLLKGRHGRRYTKFSVRSHHKLPHESSGMKKMVPSYDGGCYLFTLPLYFRPPSISSRLYSGLILEEHFLSMTRVLSHFIWPSAMVHRIQLYIPWCALALRLSVPKIGGGEYRLSSRLVSLRTEYKDSSYDQVSKWIIICMCTGTRE